MPSLLAGKGERETKRHGGWVGGPSAASGDSGNVALFETVLEVIFIAPLAPPSTGAALAPPKPKRLVPLHPGGYHWLVFTGDGGGDSSNFLFHDEILISLALSTLQGDGPAETFSSVVLN